MYELLQLFALCLSCNQHWPHFHLPWNALYALATFSGFIKMTCNAFHAAGWHTWPMMVQEDWILKSPRTTVEDNYHQLGSHLAHDTLVERILTRKRFLARLAKARTQLGSAKGVRERRVRKARDLSYRYCMTPASTPAIQQSARALLHRSNNLQPRPRFLAR